MFSMMFALVVSGCMTVHSVQLGDVDSTVVRGGERFEIKLSAIGFNTEEIAELVKIAASSPQAQKRVDSMEDTVAMFQQGPRTGDTVVDPRFSDRMRDELRKRCPSGRVSGLMTIRETADYPGLSGEIVKLIGYCGGDQ